jgi:RNA polymerase sigma factor for flagellar operon FliA
VVFDAIFSKVIKEPGMFKTKKNNDCRGAGTTVAPKNQVDEIWLRYKQDPENIDLRNRLIEHYMPLVCHRVDRFRTRLPGEIERGDLVSAGTFGLVDAITTFDPGRGVKFETFCLPRVHGAIVDELRSMDWVPRKVRSKTTKLNEAYKVLEGKFGRRPSEEEIAAFLEMPVDEVHKTIRQTGAVNITSLDKSWTDSSGESNVSEMDILADKNGEAPSEKIDRQELIRVCTKGLSQNERLIIILYYYEGLTMKEIGATLDLSESRVSQIHSSIVERIKKIHHKRLNDI